MSDKKKKKKSQMPSHVNLVPNLRQQTAYKNYRMSGGEASFEQFQKENKK